MPKGRGILCYDMMKMGKSLLSTSQRTVVLTTEEAQKIADKRWGTGICSFVGTFHEVDKHAQEVHNSRIVTHYARLDELILTGRIYNPTHKPKYVTEKGKVWYVCIEEKGHIHNFRPMQGYPFGYYICRCGRMDINHKEEQAGQGMKKVSGMVTWRR